VGAGGEDRGGGETNSIYIYIYQKKISIYIYIYMNFCAVAMLSGALGGGWR